MIAKSLLGGRDVYQLTQGEAEPADIVSPVETEPVDILSLQQRRRAKVITSRLLVPTREESYGASMGSKAELIEEGELHTMAENAYGTLLDRHADELPYSGVEKMIAKPFQKQEHFKTRALNLEISDSWVEAEEPVSCNASV